MKEHIYIPVLLGIVLVLSACNINAPGTPNQAVGETTPLSLLVQVQNPTETFDTVGDVINYTYVISNPGITPLAGPLILNDNIANVTCPELTTIGDKDNELDPGESITCSGTYSIIQADLDAGLVANSATASLAGGTILSAPGGITVHLTPGAPGKTLGLAKTADPLTYNFAGQTIAYIYVITNTGSLAIGPAQFIVTDDHIGGGSTPIACGLAGTTLEPGGTITCRVTYTITNQDMTATSVTNTARASGGDAQASPPISTTISNSNFQGNVTPGFTPGPTNLTPGTTIQHQVVKGEWLLQIARCYGVRYESLRNANLQVPNPSEIDPGLIVTVPNIGSAGTIFGPPCVVFHTVVAGDTWNSIAAQYNARVDVLQEANPKGLVTGTQIKVPINSAGASYGNTPIVVTSTITPTATPTATSTLGSVTPGTGEPTRITFPAGATSASVSGTLAGHETVSYLVAATQGQTMTISLVASANEIATRVQDPNGILVKQLDGNLIWTGLLSATGDYQLDLVGLTDPNKIYTLTVTLTGP